MKVGGGVGFGKGKVLAVGKHSIPVAPNCPHFIRDPFDLALHPPRLHRRRSKDAAATYVMWLQCEVVRSPVGIDWDRFGTVLGFFGPRQSSNKNNNVNSLSDTKI